MQLVTFKTPSRNMSNKHKISLFCLDMTGSHWAVSYLVITSGLFIFSILYGYFQEIIVYSWFERKLSYFSTFLHFLGCSGVALTQRTILVKSQMIIDNKIAYDKIDSDSIDNKVSYDMSNINKSLISECKAPFRYLIFLSAMKCTTQALTNLSMMGLNYPAKVMFKSALPIVSMLIGIIFYQKKYSGRDYTAVLLLVVGLVVFMWGPSGSEPEATCMGIVLVLLSLVGSAGIPLLQVPIISTYLST